MTLLIALALAAAPDYGDLEPFSNEQAAALAFEKHIHCVGTAAFDRRDAAGEPEGIAAEVVQLCAEEAAALRAALVDVYSRKPSLIGSGADAAEAADHYVSGVKERVAIAIQKSRKPVK